MGIVVGEEVDRRPSSMALEVFGELLVEVLSEMEAECFVGDVVNDDVTEQVGFVRRWRVGDDRPGPQIQQVRGQPSVVERVPKAPVSHSVRIGAR